MHEVDFVKKKKIVHRAAVKKEFLHRNWAKKKLLQAKNPVNRKLILTAEAVKNKQSG